MADILDISARATDDRVAANVHNDEVTSARRRSQIASAANIASRCEGDDTRQHEPKMAKLDLGPTGSLHQTVQAIVMVLAVINPVVCGSIFLMLTRSFDSGKKRRAAINVTLFILAILVVSALVGLKVLSAFGISLDVFRIVGGMIIAYMGFDMLRGRNLVGQAPPSESDVNAGGSLAPLIMFAAGPGTITAVVTLAAVHTPDGLPSTALAAAVVGTAVSRTGVSAGIRIANIAASSENSPMKSARTIS